MADIQLVSICHARNLKVPLVILTIGIMVVLIANIYAFIGGATRDEATLISVVSLVASSIVAWKLWADNVGTEGYAVYLRKPLSGWRLTKEPLSHAEAEQFAQSVVRAILSHWDSRARSNSSSPDDVHTSRTITNAEGEHITAAGILAGNSIIVEVERIISGDQAFPLEGASGVSVSADVPRGFAIIRLLSLGVFFAYFSGFLGMMAWTSTLNSNSAEWVWLRLLVFLSGVILALGIAAYGIVVLPVVWVIRLDRGSHKEVVYKSENKQQADAYARDIRRALAALRSK